MALLRSYGGQSEGSWKYPGISFVNVLKLAHTWLFYLRIKVIWGKIHLIFIVNIIFQALNIFINFLPTTFQFQGLKQAEFSSTKKDVIQSYLVVKTLPYLQGDYLYFVANLTFHFIIAKPILDKC